MVRQSEVTIIRRMELQTQCVAANPTTSGFYTRTQAKYLTMKQSQSRIGQLATIVRTMPMAIQCPYYTVMDLGGGACPFPTCLAPAHRHSNTSVFQSGLLARYRLTAHASSQKRHLEFGYSQRNTSKCTPKNNSNHIVENHSNRDQISELSPPATTTSIKAP